MTLKSTLPSFAADPNSMLRRIRRVREISIDELSQQCNIPAADIRRWERTNTYPEIERLRTLAKVLKVKPTLLTVDTSKAPTPEAVEDIPAWFIAETQRILTLFPPRR